VLLGDVASLAGEGREEGFEDGLLVGYFVVGVLGTFLGGWLFGVLDLSIGGKWVGPIVTSIIGAIVLIFAIGKLKKA